MSPIGQIMPRSILISCLVAALSMGGCADQPLRNDLFQATFNAPYTLASGDRVRVLVFGQDALSNAYSVSGSGTISLPLAGEVRVFGLTTALAERAVEARLRQGFLRDPKVSIEVEAFRPFFVLGEVTAAGQYPFINGMTIRKAIAVAGGFTPRGDQHDAIVTRVIGGQSVAGRFPLDWPLRPGDTVTVEERIF